MVIFDQEDPDRPGEVRHRERSGRSAGESSPAEDLVGAEAVGISIVKVAPRPVPGLWR